MVKIKLGILISGNGSNMQAIANSCQNCGILADIATVAVVISNNPQAKGLQWAEKQGLATAVVDHKSFALATNPRLEFEQKLYQILQQYSVDLVCLAGFMRLLTPFFVNAWYDRLINIHPSLLPDFKGANAVSDAFLAKVKIVGCTTHFVREQMDSGPIILQQSLVVNEDDTLESLKTRILALEHQIYPQTIKIVCNKILQN